VQIPRSRGGLSGLILVLLGAWGGLIPLVGPYLKYGYTPDRTWDLTQGRLYLSVIPGAVVLLAGLVIVMTRSRGLGGFFAFVAALAGIWFIAGAAVIELLPASLRGSISTGTPIATTVTRAILTSLGFYAGLGALILFFAALALGRFSIAAHKDHLRFGELAGAAGLAGAGAAAYDSYESRQGQPGQYAPTQQYPSGPDSFPASPDQYPTSQDQYPTQDHSNSTDPFSAGPSPYSQYPTTEQQTPPAALVVRLRWCGTELVAAVAEADGNRTRRRRDASSTSFEDRGDHQVPRHLRSRPYLVPGI
jgi:hypothetical protein